MHRPPTRQHVHREHFPSSAEWLFRLLITPSAICQWWGAARAIVIPREGGVWAAAWGDDEDEPDYVTTAIIRSYLPGQRLVLANYDYVAKDGGLPFEADFTTSFDVTADADGAWLQVTQDGFPVGPEADDFLVACEYGWTKTFEGIRRYLNER